MAFSNPSSGFACHGYTGRRIQFSSFYNTILEVTFEALSNSNSHLPLSKLIECDLINGISELGVLHQTPHFSQIKWLRITPKIKATTTLECVLKHECILKIQSGLLFFVFLCPT